MGTPIDKAGGGGFRVTKKGKTGGSLATDKGGGQVEVVLGSTEGAERNTD